MAVEMSGRKEGRGAQDGGTPARDADWSEARETRRVWLEDSGGDCVARLQFLSEQGLRLIMADAGPGGRETLHFFNPRDAETLHLRAGGGKSLLLMAAEHFPQASRWIELLRGGEEGGEEPAAGTILIRRGGLLLQVGGGRVRRVYEAAREYPQGSLSGTKAGQAAAILERGGRAEGTARAVAFAQALEGARGMKVPVAATALRCALLELARARAHLAWMGEVARLLRRPAVAEGCGAALARMGEAVGGLSWSTTW